MVHRSGEIIIFHQPRFPWNEGISLTKPPFGVRSCEFAIIGPDRYMIMEDDVEDHFSQFSKEVAGFQSALGSANETSSPNPMTMVKDISSWWLNQPIWKICANQIGSSPQVGLKI